MTVDQFWRLFLIELRDRRDLWGYYKFLASPRSHEFRRSYFQRRLEYLGRHVDELKPARILDVGCGYGTSALFLALNGWLVHGTTLEHYEEGLAARLKFWSAHGDVSRLTVDHESLFERPPAPGSYDLVLAQDTLHHLEPLAEALGILRRALTPRGCLVAVEENGDHLVQRFRLYLRRGDRRVVEIHDPTLGRSILMGNENIRGREAWKAELEAAGFELRDEDYIRLLPAPFFNATNRLKLEAMEGRLWRRSAFLKRYFFFGINFSASRKTIPPEPRL